MVAWVERIQSRKEFFYRCIFILTFDRKISSKLHGACPFKWVPIELRKSLDSQFYVRLQEYKIDCSYAWLSEKINAKKMGG